MEKNIFKIVVIGEARVGKSSIALRYVQNEFDPNSLSTVDACCLEKEININNEKVKLSIWDTAGQQKYNALVPVYYRDAEAALIVYDITSSESFQKVKKWISELKKYSNRNAILAVVGNKIDLNIMRKVNKDQARQQIESEQILFYEVSAKTGEGVNKMFEQLGKNILSNRKKNKSPNVSFDKSRRSRINLGIEEEKVIDKGNKEKKRCCG